MRSPPASPRQDLASPIVITPRRHWVLLMLALWLLATLGLRPLLLPDEGRYAEVAREMLLGDGVVPTLHGLPYFHKPPLLYWLDMAAMGVLGVNPFAARIAPALGAWLMGAALYLDLQRRAGPRVATVALGVLATCPLYFGAAQFVNHDMLVAGLITVAVVCAVRAVDDPQRAALRWVVAAWGAMALALLAKGLIGVVLPALIVGPWLLAQGRWRAVLQLMHPLALAAFAVLAAPWFIAMESRYPGFADYFFVEQHFRRYTQSAFNNPQPVWFYLPVLLLLTLPWSLWLPAALRRWRAVDSALPLALYAWWAVAVIGFFSLPTSKLVGYVLPVLAPLAALIGLTACRGRAWRWVMPLAALVCLAGIAALAWQAPGSQRDIGLSLGARVQQGDRVVFVDAPFFDVPFHARLTQPPIVLSDWDDPAIARRDNWRKELHDAARFDAQAAARQLWRNERAATLLCTTGTVWFVAGKGWQPPPGLAGALTRVHEGRLGQLLRAEGGPRPGCP